MYSDYIRPMPTTVHIPDELLAKVDERARAMKMARNRYIVEALRKALSEQSAWSPAFLEALDHLEPIEGVDDLEAAIRANRTRKRPPRL
jgi:predicted transcriptional regulator